MTPLKLSKTYDAGSEPFSELVFREPTYADYRQIGPAYEVQNGLVLRDRDAIFGYAERLVTKPAAGALVALNLEDTMALEDHILRFFSATRGSMIKRTGSSSGSTGTQDTSTGSP